MQVRLDDIGKQYGDHWIFQHISAQLQPDHVYPIIGNNGSGKSTLMLIIAGYVTPNDGEVAMHDGETALPIESWYKHLSIAAPSMDLFEEFTVSEAVSLHHQLKPLEDITTSHLLELIELDNHASKQLRNLSSGMRQRLKLALALHTASQVLLLDEPCSNLDKKWMRWYNESLATRKNGKVVVICSNEHSEELAHATDTPIDVSASIHH